LQFRGCACHGHERHDADDLEDDQGWQDFDQDARSNWLVEPAELQRGYPRLKSAPGASRRDGAWNPGTRTSSKDGGETGHMSFLQSNDESPSLDHVRNGRTQRGWLLPTES
jgi:hypothetical protein